VFTVLSLEMLKLLKQEVSEHSNDCAASFIPNFCYNFFFNQRHASSQGSLVIDTFKKQIQELHEVTLWPKQTTP